MILPQHFHKNESLRHELIKSKSIIDIAFHAANNQEDLDVKVDDSNALSNAQKHAERAGILRFQRIIHSMMELPSDEPSPLLETHLGIDAYDLIGIKAEEEAAAESKISKQNKKK